MFSEGASLEMNEITFLKKSIFTLMECRSGNLLQGRINSLFHTDNIFSINFF